MRQRCQDQSLLLEARFLLRLVLSHVTLMLARLPPSISASYLAFDDVESWFRNDADPCWLEFLFRYRAPLTDGVPAFILILILTCVFTRLTTISLLSSHPPLHGRWVTG